MTWEQMQRSASQRPDVKQESFEVQLLSTKLTPQASEGHTAVVGRLSTSGSMECQRSASSSLLGRLCKASFAQERVELSPDGQLSAAGVSLDLTQPGNTVALPQRARDGRPFCLKVRNEQHKVVMDAGSADELAYWLEAAKQFKASASSNGGNQHTFAIRRSGKSIVILKFAISRFAAMAVHHELVAGRGLCAGLTFPGPGKGEALALESYYTQLFSRNDVVADPVFSERMGFDLLERGNRVPDMVKNDPQVLRRAMVFFRAAGEVLYHDRAVGTRDRVFLRPQRLVDLMKEFVRHDLESELAQISAVSIGSWRGASSGRDLVLLGEQFLKRGVLDRQLVPWLWRKLQPPVTDEAETDFLIELLALLGLLTRWPGSKQQWLLPMRLPERNVMLATVAAQGKFAEFATQMETELSSSLDLVDAVRSIAQANLIAASDLEAGCAVAFRKADDILDGAERDELGLNRDQIASINLYTQEVMGAGATHANVYRPLNAALRSEDLGRIRPFWHYIGLLQQSLLTLPVASTPGKPLPSRTSYLIPVRATTCVYTHPGKIHRIYTRYILHAGCV
jgi:hypothetical protein